MTAQEDRMEQVAGVEALAGALDNCSLPLETVEDDGVWQPHSNEQWAAALIPTLYSAGWQLTRVGDEERLRAALDWCHRHHAFGPEHCSPANCSVAQFLAGGVRADDPSLAWNVGASQPPSPASQGEKR